MRSLLFLVPVILYSFKRPARESMFFSGTYSSHFSSFFGMKAVGAFVFLTVVAVTGAWPPANQQGRHSTAEAPSFMSFAPTASAIQPAPAHDAMPVLPTPGDGTGSAGGGFEAAEGSLPVIPSSPSTGNPDEPLPTIDTAPLSGAKVSAAGPLRWRFASAMAAAWPIVLLLRF